MSNEVLDAVRELLPGIAERARSVDEKGSIPAETIRELTAAGVFRMLQPVRYGGAEDDPVAFYEVIRAISGACGSTGWVAAILGVHSWHVGLFADEAQHEVWGAARTPSSPRPMPRSAAHPGRRRLRGERALVVLVRLRVRVLGAARRARRRRGGPSGRLHDGARPEDRLRDPRGLGLDGPARHRQRRHRRGAGVRPGAPRDAQLRAGAAPQPRPQGQHRPAVPDAVRHDLHRHRHRQRDRDGGGCHDLYVARMRDRIRLSLGGGRFVEDPFAQVAVARAASEIDAAVLQTDRNVREIHEYALRNEKIPMELRLRARRDQVRGTERAIEAIDILFKTAGGNSCTAAASSNAPGATPTRAASTWRTTSSTPCRCTAAASSA